MRRFLSALVVVLGVAHSAAAQEPVSLPPPPPPPAVDAEKPPPIEDAEPFEVNWLPVPITAGVGVVTGAILGFAFVSAIQCPDDGGCAPITDELVVASVFGGLMVGGIGALVGLLIVPFTGLFSSTDEPSDVAFDLAPHRHGVEGSLRLAL
jgi:hypothetical protein